MAKGKSRPNLTGVSRFLDAFNTSVASTPSSQKSESTAKETDDDNRPTKKLKMNAPKHLPSDSAYQSYDATGLVPFYIESSQVPDDLKKYFSQRRRYFSLYDKGCLLDRVGWYSVTPELIANQIAERCRCDTILDAFCGVGGNAIAFAQTCEHVIAIDNDETRLQLARHNAAIYGVADRIEFILGDFIQFAGTLSARGKTRQGGRAVDVVFLSPPWGGPSYLQGSNQSLSETPGHPEFRLADITPVDGLELFKLAERITPNIAYYLPRNTNLQEISDLVESSGVGGTKGNERARMVEIEEEWMKDKLKALTCYFGGLVQGQEDLF